MIEADLLAAIIAQPDTEPPRLALDAAVAAALDGDRVVATRRLDALTAELAHPLAFEWWALQGLAHWALARELPEDARELVRTLERASYYGP